MTASGVADSVICAGGVITGAVVVATGAGGITGAVVVAMGSGSGSRLWFWFGLRFRLRLNGDDWRGLRRRDDFLFGYFYHDLIHRSSHEKPPICRSAAGNKHKQHRCQNERSGACGAAFLRNAVFETADRLVLEGFHLEARSAGRVRGMLSMDSLNLSAPVGSLGVDTGRNVFRERLFSRYFFIKRRGIHFCPRNVFLHRVRKNFFSPTTGNSPGALFVGEASPPFCCFDPYVNLLYNTVFHIIKKKTLNLCCCCVEKFGEFRVYLCCLVSERR